MSEATVKKVFELRLDDDPNKLLIDQDWIVYQDKIVVGNYKTYEEALVCFEKIQAGGVVTININD